jgi:uncharacterized protein YfiM (DUF2279 family)
MIPFLQSFLVASIIASTQNAPPPDPIFGEDKVQHFVTSFVVSSLVMSGARLAGLDRRDSIIAGASVSLTIGIGKEVHDARRGQFFSVRDLLWDMAGTGAGVLLLDQTR